VGLYQQGVAETSLAGFLQRQEVKQVELLMVHDSSLSMLHPVLLCNVKEQMVC
jgi:hypothetical protein